MKWVRFIFNRKRSAALKARFLNQRLGLWRSICSGNLPPWCHNRIVCRVVLVLIACTTCIAHAQQPEGFVVPWGRSPDFSPRTPLFTAIAAGWHHLLGLTREGTVIAMAGWDPVGYARVPSGLSNVVAIAAGDDFSLALKQDGTVVAWGDNSDGQANVPIGLTNVIAIAAGGWHSLALKRDGTVVAWGAYGWGATSVPPGLNGVIAIAAGGDGSYAIKQDGTAISWGQQPAPSVLRSVTAIAASGNATLVLKQDGTVLAFGGALPLPSDLTGVVAIAAGPYRQLALKQDGTVVSWGYLGHDPTPFALAAPRDVGKVISISAMYDAGYALVNIAPSNVRLAPAAQTVEVGSQISYAAQPYGPAPFVYKWLFNETNIVSVSTNSVMVLSNIQLNQAGAYSVQVANTYGDTTSPPVWLSVIPAVVHSIHPVIQLTGELGSFLHLSYSDALGSDAVWQPLDEVTLTNTPQFYMDLSEPSPHQRFYRAWQTNLPNPAPTMRASFATQITLTGMVGSMVRIDYINAVGPTNAWVTLDTVTLTNSPEFYFDFSVFRRPSRVYRVVPLP